MGVARTLMLVMIASGCGGATSRPHSPPADEATVIGRGTADDPVQLCHMNGGMGRTDYPYVARYRCSDGSTPLRREPERGAAARRGNVGPGPDGHIVDLYDIPCPSGNVELYVDGYHCGDDVDTAVDPNNLTREQLGRMARMIRALHEDPSSDRALGLRRELLLWVVQSQQFNITVCDGIAGLLPAEAPAYTGELMISLAASVIEDGGDPADPVRVNLYGLYGVLVYYESMVRAQGEGARVPALDTLVAMARDQTLEARVRELVSGCTFERMGVHLPR